MNKSMNMLLGIMASIIVTSLAINPVMAESTITLESDKKIFEPTSRIFLTGTVDPGDKFYDPVMLTVYDANGNAILNAKSTIDNDNQFSALITGPLGSFDEGLYIIEATHTSTTESTGIAIGITDRTS